MKNIKQFENKVINGDCIEVMKTMPDNSVDTVICDPPYELNFMGKGWDNQGIAFQKETWEEVLRVAKPGATLMAFGGTRTYHRLACAIEDAGWQIFDCIFWIYGVGFPKSHNIHKALKKKGSEKADEWLGWGSALKPAVEPIVCARKPLDGTYANNVLKWGVSGLNIDGGRIGTKPRTTHKDGNYRGNIPKESEWADDKKGFKKGFQNRGAQGRFPSNIILDEQAAEMLDEQSGDCKASGKYKQSGNTEWYGGKSKYKHTMFNDKGGASRFFKIIK